VLLPRQQAKLARGAKDKEHAMSQIPNTAIAVIGIDIGKNFLESRRKAIEDVLSVRADEESLN
jgi:hypothetical protein